MMGRFSRLSRTADLLRATGAATVFFCSAGAHAQSTPATDQSTAGDAGIREDEISEVVVTAQKRSQSINDVGLSITALSADDLRDRNINDTSDLAKVVSGLTYTPTPVGPPVYTLRGVGFYDASLSAAPAVTVYVDEAPLAFPAMSQVGVIDVERVEVLSGPQGTLYGENSTGGAINFVAARPTAEWTAGGAFGYGRFQTSDAKGYVSGPISDTLATRIAFRAVNSGDWQRSYTRNETLGATHQFAGRAMFDWTPTEKLNATLTLNTWRDTSDFQAYQLDAVECAVPSNCAYPDDYPTAPSNARDADWTPGWPMSMNDKFQQAVARVEYELTPAVTLTSISGYQQLDISKSSDTDATYLPVTDTTNRGEIDSFNQELRLSGDWQALNWVAGLYYSHAKVFDEFGYITELQSSSVVIPGMPGFVSTKTPSDTQLDNYAVFASGDYKLTDSLTLVGGLRYTQSERDFSGCTLDTDGGNLANIVNALQTAVLGSLVLPAVPGGCITLSDAFLPGKVDRRIDEDNVSWRTGLNWKVAGDTLLYATISKGYKAGSIPVVSASAAVQFTPAPQEEMLAYEAGIKAPLFNRRLQLNAAGFFYDYKNKQLRGQILDPAFGLVEAMVSIPESRVYGFEGQLVARPVAGLDLSASVTYLDTEVETYTGYDDTGTQKNYSGESFPYSPKWQSMGDARYGWNFGTAKRAFVGASLIQRSDSYARTGRDQDFKLPSYVLLGLRAGFESLDDAWRVTFWGDNVTDRYYWNGVAQYWDTRFRQAGRPATYGVTLSYNY